MRFRRPRLRFFLDEGVPNAVGLVLEKARHKVHYLNRGDLLPRGSPDQLVCALAVQNGAILVAMDSDMRTIARGSGVVGSVYARLNLLKLSCAEPDAAARVREALSLIEHEWHVNEGAAGRRLFIEVKTSVIRTNR